jgi:penicillin-insensitive murein endopeptidase
MALALLCAGTSLAARAHPPALSYGSGSCGKLEGGVPLECEGPNFAAFTPLACERGRNHLHPLVVETVQAAYAELARTSPERRWQYGELGLAAGGRLAPHRTHQNGLSADFFVPVSTPEGRPAVLPILEANRYGYGLELDSRGRLGELTVDWKALAAHLLALDAAGVPRGVRVERVILTPAFHRLLAQHAPEVRPLRTRFMRREAWVRHDEHYHVDFAIPAGLRRSLRCR